MKISNGTEMHVKPEDVGAERVFAIQTQRVKKLAVF